MLTKIMNFFKDDEGASAVEYGIMVAAIAAIIVGVAFFVGSRTDNALERVNAAMEGNNIGP